MDHPTYHPNLDLRLLSPPGIRFRPVEEHEQQFYEQGEASLTWLTLVKGLIVAGILWIAFFFGVGLCKVGLL